MRVDFAATRRAVEKEGLVGGGDYLKFREGANRMRLLNEPIPHPSEYLGTKTFKWLCYVVDRGDGQVKPFFMPHTIYKAIEALQKSDDYGFDEVPMPYDITVNADGAGTKEVKYTVMPARNSTPLTPGEIASLAAKKPIEELRTALRAKGDQGNGHEAPRDTQPFDPDEIPV